MSTEMIIRTCISQENLETLADSLPSYVHSMCSRADVMRIIKINMNIVLTKFEQELQHVSGFHGRDAVIAVDRRVKSAAMTSFDRMFETKIDELPVVEGIWQQWESVEPQPVNPSEPRNLLAQTWSEPYSGPSDFDQIETDPTEPDPLTTQDDDRGSDEGYFDIDSRWRTPEQTVHEYKVQLPDNIVAGKLVELHSVCFDNRTGPTVTRQSNCFYFSEDDHPMHTIKVPVKQWGCMKSLLAWIESAMNRVSDHRYSVGLTSSTTSNGLGHISITGQGKFNLLFEQNPNGIHRTLGFTRRNHKGKSSYRSNAQPTSISPGSDGATVAFGSITWKAGDAPKSVILPPDGVVSICTLDAFGALFDFGEHIIKLRLQQVHLPVQLSNPLVHRGTLAIRSIDST